MFFPKTQVILGFAIVRGCDARHDAITLIGGNNSRVLALSECKVFDAGIIRVLTLRTIKLHK
jgi:hypothetical protein